MSQYFPKLLIKYIIACCDLLWQSCALMQILDHVLCLCVKYWGKGAGLATRLLQTLSGRKLRGHWSTWTQAKVPLGFLVLASGRGRAAVFTFQDSIHNCVVTANGFHRYCGVCLHSEDSNMQTERVRTWRLLSSTSTWCASQSQTFLSRQLVQGNAQLPALLCKHATPFCFVTWTLLLQEIHIKLLFK